MCSRATLDGGAQAGSTPGGLTSPRTTHRTGTVVRGSRGPSPRLPVHRPLSGNGGCRASKSPPMKRGGGGPLHRRANRMRCRGRKSPRSCSYVCSCSVPCPPARTPAPPYSPFPAPSPETLAAAGAVAAVATVAVAVAVAAAVAGGKQPPLLLLRLFLLQVLPPAPHT